MLFDGCTMMFKSFLPDSVCVIREMPFDDC
jgi:hypothetical protein